MDPIPKPVATSRENADVRDQRPELQEFSGDD